MADNVESASGSGGPTFATDDVSNVHYPFIKLVDGTLNSSTKIEAGNGTSAGALRVTVSSDSTGVLSVDDNGGALTVDNAGTFAVQEDGAALTALQLIDDVVHTDDAAFTLGTSKGVMMMGFAGTQSVNANDAGAIAMETDGSVHIHDGGNSITVDGTVTANLSATDNAVLDNIDTNTDYGQVVGGGVEATALRVTLASDSTGLLSVDDNGGSLTVDNGGTFAVQVDAALPAGTNAIGKLAANSGVDIGDVDVTSISAGSNLIGDVGLSGARTSGGTTPKVFLDVDETEEEVKATAGQVYWIHAMNLSSAVLYLKFYNATAATVVVGTTTPVLTFPIPTQGDTNGAGFTLSIPNGIAFGTAICIAATTGIADADTGAPGTNALVVNLGYA